MPKLVFSSLLLLAQPGDTTGGAEASPRVSHRGGARRQAVCCGRRQRRRRLAQLDGAVRPGDERVGGGGADGDGTGRPRSCGARRQAVRCWQVRRRRRSTAAASSEHLERYDPALDAWEAVAPMAAARSRLSVAVLDGKLYAVGGYSGDGSYLSSVERYDPATNAWEAVAPLTLARSGPGWRRWKASCTLWRRW